MPWPFSYASEVEVNQYNKITKLRPSPFPDGEADISWLTSDVRFGIGTFDFVASATYRPSIINTALFGVKSVLVDEEENSVTLKSNSSTYLMDYLDTWTDVNFKNLVLFDNDTGTPFVWWELDAEYNLSRKLLNIYLSPFYIKFIGAIGSAIIGPLYIGASKTNNKYGTS